MKYCYNCHKHVNVNEKIRHCIDLIMKVYLCQECGKWLETISEPVIEDKEK